MLSRLATHEPQILRTWRATVDDSLSTVTAVSFEGISEAHRAEKQTGGFVPAVALRETPACTWIVFYKIRQSGRHQVLCAARFTALGPNSVDVLIHECLTYLYPIQAGQLAHALYDLFQGLYGVSFARLDPWPEVADEQRALLTLFAND
jgi:hypothetical protein